MIREIFLIPTIIYQNGVYISTNNMFFKISNSKLAGVEWSHTYTVGNTHINASASFGLVYWPQGPITIYRRGLAKKIGPTL